MVETPEEKLDPRIRRFLDVIDTPSLVIDCDPALADTRDFCSHYGYPPEDCANAILVKSKTGAGTYALCILLATTRFDVNRTVRKRLGARKASFATPEETREITGMEIGGVTPIALPDGLPVWVDSAVMARDRVILGAGIRGAKIITERTFFDHVDGVEIVEGLAMPI